MVTKEKLRKLSKNYSN